MRTNKKIVMLVMMCIALFTSNKASGESVWKIHSVFNTSLVKEVDAGDKVYFLDDKYLYSYDKATKQIENYNRTDQLSDDWVKNIYYNKAKKFLFVTYNSGNMDVFTEGGTKVNIPDFKNLKVIGTKAVNDVTFAEGRIYVGTTSGYYVIDDSNYRIIETNYWGSNVQSVAELSTKMLISDGTKIYYADKGRKITSANGLAQATVAGNATITMMPVDGDTCFVHTTTLYRVYPDASGVMKFDNVSAAKLVDYQPANEGFIGVVGTSVSGTNSIIYFNKRGIKTKKVTFPATLKGSLLSSLEPDGSLWALGVKGLQKITLSDAGVVTELTEKVLPNSCTANLPYFLTYNKGLNKMYVMNTGTNYHFVKYGNVGTICTYDGEKWEDMAPESATTIGKLKNNKVNDPYYPVFDPDDPETYYVGTWYDGAYKIKGKEVLAKYDWTNSPLSWALNKFYCNVGGLQFDKHKNLWLTQTLGTSDGDAPRISVLPRDKQDKTELTAEDWLTPKVPGFRTAKYQQFIITKDDIKVYLVGGYHGPIIVFDDGGNPASDNIRSKVYSEFIDEKGKQFQWQYSMVMAEDLDGIIWVGASSGLVCFDPSKALNDDFRVTHKRLKDNPGKYVLDNVWTSCIAVDEYNRKWVGTIEDGVYLLNAAGDEVLAHYTRSNSIMNDDYVISLGWNSGTKSMFMGVNGTLYEIKPDASLFSSDFSDMEVTPKYIKPDYRDFVRIYGVPSGSTLKIKDKEGNVVRTLECAKNENAWDCLDEEGQRADTGVYTIEAVSGDGSIVKAEAAKIYLIK